MYLLFMNTFQKVSIILYAPCSIVLQDCGMYSLQLIRAMFKLCDSELTQHNEDSLLIINAW